MSQIDVNEQWRRLQETYASMADEELEAIAKEAYDLTDIARQVLSAEIARRHLTIQLRQTPPAESGSSVEDELPQPDENGSISGYPDGFDPEDWGLVSFSRVDNIEQGRKLKKCFDDAGIPAYFGPDVVDNLRLLPSSLKGPLEVKVREVDLGRARVVMNNCTLSLRTRARMKVPTTARAAPSVTPQKLSFRNSTKRGRVRNSTGAAMPAAISGRTTASNRKVSGCLLTSSRREAACSDPP